MLLSWCLFSAVGLGIVSHLGYFIRGEHHWEFALLLKVFTTAFVVLIAVQMRIVEMQQAVSNTFLIAIAYFIALFMSVTIYRVYFHRLNGFPGPAAAKVTKLWHVTRILHCDNYRQLHQLHKEYGDFVRTGPNEVSIFKPEALPAILGHKSKCGKSIWYDAIRTKLALNIVRDKSSHENRRRVWDYGFSRKALLIYEGRVLRYVWQLEQKLSMLSGKPTNATRLLRFFSFDVIGDLTLGTKFQMLESDVEHFAADVLRRGMLPLGVLTPVPWLLLILSRVPGLLSGWDNMISWSDQQVERRIKEQPSDPDIFTWWLDASLKNNSVEKDRIWLDGDSLLAILAGSDTVSATLILSLYYLARYPAQVDKLREELRSFDSSVNESKLQALPHLNAFINETLRLHPPVPSGLLRETPPEGLTIAGQYIPGSTTVVAPFYTISRLESCFESAEDFIPERWTSKPQMVKDKTAFAPFSLGLYSCIGKNLALMEVRAVITCIISKFDIDFAPGESSSAVLEDMHDTFTAAPGPLNLVFRIRE